MSIQSRNFPGAAVKHKPCRTLCAALVLMALSACNRQSIILVPDHDGHVGKAEVTTKAGTQLLENDGDMTRTRGASRAPSAVTKADPAFIEATFNEALAVEPPPAQTFTLMFESGSTALTEESRQEISNIAAAVKDRPAITVSISGHTDATGSDELNNVLSLERATQVEALLVQQGVDSSIITVTSHGKGNPLISTPDGVAEPRNRRVVVIIH